MKSPACVAKQGNVRDLCGLGVTQKVEMVEETIGVRPNSKRTPHYLNDDCPHDCRCNTLLQPCDASECRIICAFARALRSHER